MLSGEGVSNGSATDCKDEDGDSNDLSDAHFNFYNKNIFLWNLYPTIIENNWKLLYFRKEIRKLCKNLNFQ